MIFEQQIPKIISNDFWASDMKNNIKKQRFLIISYNLFFLSFPFISNVGVCTKAPVRPSSILESGDKHILKVEGAKTCENQGLTLLGRTHGGKQCSDTSSYCAKHQVKGWSQSADNMWKYTWKAGRSKNNMMWPARRAQFHCKATKTIIFCNSFLPWAPICSYAFEAKFKQIRMLFNMVLILFWYCCEYCF